MDKEEFEQQMLEEMQNLEEEGQSDQQQNDFIERQAWQEAYGVPEQEQQFNQHAFLANSLMFDSPEKVTFVNESELGRPLFNLRFLLDIEDICKYYLDGLSTELGTQNQIAEYFRAKIVNICSSGMSHKGFVQNLNASKKIDVTRKRVRELEPLKGGKVR